MSSAIKCPRCKQRISVPENEQLLICPMCKTRLDVPESDGQPPTASQSMNPNVSSPPVMAPQQHPVAPPNGGVNQGVDQRSVEQRSREKSFAETNFEPPGSGSSLAFVFFLLGVFALFIAVLGVLIWMLVKAM